MLPIKQYSNQHNQLWEKLYNPLVPQLKDDLWVQLRRKLQYELGEESLGSTLKEELEYRWYP